MDARTLEALQASIIKYEKLAKEGYSVSLGANNCALCQIYHIPRMVEDECFGCPIHEVSGQKYCQGTPFEEVICTRYGNQEEFKAHCQREVDFLKSLLPSNN